MSDGEIIERLLEVIETQAELIGDMVQAVRQAGVTTSLDAKAESALELGKRLRALNVAPYADAEDDALSGSTR